MLNICKRHRREDEFLDHVVFELVLYSDLFRELL